MKVGLLIEISFGLSWNEEVNEKIGPNSMSLG
jgi:hypothetical protein